MTVNKHIEEVDGPKEHDKVEINGSSPEEKCTETLSVILPDPPVTHSNSNAGLEVNAEMPSSPMPASVEGMNKGIILSNALAKQNSYVAISSTTAPSATTDGKSEDISPPFDTNISPRVNDGSLRKDVPDVFRGRHHKSGSTAPS